MTRIIAGLAGGVRLQTPAGTDTRPTSDRVREALFSALEARHAISGARVLDLYAGSGALGLEAASRGAAGVCLVENAKPTLSVLRSNAARVAAALAPSRPGASRRTDHLEAELRPAIELQPAIEVAAASVPSWLLRSLSQLAAESVSAPRFDLVLVDPPYRLGEPDLAEVLLHLSALLAPEALVVIERSARSPEPTWPSGMSRQVRKKYGETILWTAHWAPPADTVSP